PLKDLIDAYLSGLLDEAGLRELEECLRGDADARRYFVRYARLNTDLHLEVRARQASARALHRIEQLTLSGPLHSSNSVATGRAPRRGSILQRCLTPRTFVPAACLLLAIGVGWVLMKGIGQDGAGRESATAWLVNAQNCRWSEEEPTGDMQAGKILKLESGLAGIRFQCGARDMLEGPGSLALHCGERRRMRGRKLIARVHGPATGFEILSPQGKVSDLGTEFRISVSDNRPTDIYVFEGKVEAQPTDETQARAVSVSQNQA